MRVDLIYASTSGNVEIVIETIAEVLRQRDFEIFLSRAEQTPIAAIQNNNRFVFGTSTWEHGLLNPFFQELFEAMQAGNFKDKEAAFVGLGDKRYEPVLFCEGLEQIRRLWKDKGGKEIGSVCKIGGEPYEQLDTVVKPWASKLAQTLSSHRD